MKNTSLKSIIVLVSICLLIAAILAAVNVVTAPKIAAANEKAEAEAFAKVLDENGGFEQVSLNKLPDGVAGVYRDLDGEGYVVMLSVKGYDSSKPMSVAVGFTNEVNITKCHVISASGETSGIGSKVALPEFTSAFEDKDSSLEDVDAISGATISSSAFINAVKNSFEAVNMAMEVGTDE